MPSQRLRPMLVFCTEDMDTVVLAMLDLAMLVLAMAMLPLLPMATLLLAMVVMAMLVLVTMARGLLMLNQRLMLVCTMEDMDMVLVLDMLVLDMLDMVTVLDMAVGSTMVNKQLIYASKSS